MLTMGKLLHHYASVFTIMRWAGLLLLSSLLSIISTLTLTRHHQLLTRSHTSHPAPGEKCQTIYYSDLIKVFIC